MPSRKTIQIGAAIFNARSATLVDKLEFYVNPGESINAEITELTGITSQDVANGVTIQQAYEDLKNFSQKYKCFRNPLVWGSGVDNDSNHIWKEAGLIEENFMGRRVLDVKTIYQSVAIFENSQYSGGLVDVMKKLGLTFEGRPHTALADAINTFRVWYHLMRMFHDGKKAKK